MQNLKLETNSRGIVRLNFARATVRNAFDEATIAELRDALIQLNGDPGVRVLVFSAEGAVFCAGADINWMQRQSQRSVAENLDDSRRFAQMLQVIYESPKPTVMRINGHAF